jgi:prepilin-type N-terminal cleavage/methylation domain-containing protein
MASSFRRDERGFTLIELVIALLILGILLALAIPRYVASGRNAVLPEADNTLQELKGLSWAYYQQHGTWVGVTAANFDATFGFVAPSGGCWSYTLPVDGAAAEIQLQAQGNPGGGPPRCDALGAPGAATVTLILRGDGSSTRSQFLP